MINPLILQSERRWRLACFFSEKPAEFVNICKSAGLCDFADAVAGVVQQRLRHFQTRLLQVGIGRHTRLSLKEPDKMVFTTVQLLRQVSNGTGPVRMALEFDANPVDFSGLGVVGGMRGMDITITTTATTDEEGRALLSMLGMPLRES